MVLLRSLGWLLILGAVLIVAYDVYGWHAHGVYQAYPAGRLWQHVSPGSLDWLRGTAARRLPAGTGARLIQPFLDLPAWAVLAVPGLLLTILFRRRTRRRGRNARRFG